MVGAALLLLCALAAGARSELVDSFVEKLDGDAFTSQVLGTPQVWVVSFVGDDCQPCRDFAPDFNSMALALRGIVKVGVVNCNQLRALCAKEKIEHVPSVKGYSWEVKRNPYTGQAYKEDGTLYTGRLRFKDVSKFGTSLLPDHLVANVSAGSSFVAFAASSPALPKVLLFSAKAAVAPMYRALSLRFRSSAVFGQARDTDQALVGQFNASSFPAIYVLPAGNEASPVRFSGDVAPESIADFLRGFAAESGPEGGNATEQGAGAEAEGEGSSKGWGWVRRLSVEKLREDVLKNEEQFLVAFTDLSAADDCEQKVKGWRALGQQLAGLVFAGEVNVTTSEQREQLAAVYEVPAQLGTACVTLLLFPFGDDKEDADPLVLPSDADFKSVQQAVYDATPDTFVTRLTPATFDSFAHLDMKIPKVILFSSKTEVPPMFRVLATNFREGHQFGFVHESQTELLEQFKVEKLPHVAALFPRPDPDDKWSTLLGVLPYQGPMKLSPLVEFVVQVSSSVRNFLGHVLEVAQVEDDDQLALHCFEKKRLCVVGLFKTEAVLTDFKRVAGKWEGGGQFSFLWVHAGAGQPGASLAAQLDVPPSALPTAVVLSPTKLRVAVLPEALTFEALNSFLDGLLLGRVRTAELQALPSFEVAATMTQGGMGAASAQASQDDSAADEPPVEEEFELSEILQESVEESLSKEQKLQEVEREIEEQERASVEEANQKKKKAKKSKKKKKKSKGKEASKDEL